MTETKLPTALWVDAVLRNLAAAGVSYYIVNRGEYAGGIVLLKLNGMNGKCRLIIQQRDMDGVLGWANALGDEFPPEKAADDYIRRAVSRDPDLWAIEVEDKAMVNPFDEK
jgi:hypothetical protein